MVIIASVMKGKYEKKGTSKGAVEQLDLMSPLFTDVYCDTLGSS